MIRFYTEEAAFSIVLDNKKDYERGREREEIHMEIKMRIQKNAGLRYDTLIIH